MSSSGMPPPPPPPPPIYPARYAATAATRVVRWTVLRVFSLLLTPLLIATGAFAVLRNTGVITGIRFTFHVPSTIHLSLPASRVPVVALGAVAVLVGLIFSITVVRFARLLPFTRWLIVLVETALLGILIVLLFANNSL